MVYANPDDIQIGNYYKYTFSRNSSEYEMTGKIGHIIKITYKRNNIVFYILPEYPNYKEHSFELGSYMSLHLEPFNT